MNLSLRVVVVFVVELVPLCRNFPNPQLFCHVAKNHLFANLLRQSVIASIGISSTAYETQPVLPMPTEPLMPLFPPLPAVPLLFVVFQCIYSLWCPCRLFLSSTFLVPWMPTEYSTLSLFCSHSAYVALHLSVPSLALSLSPVPFVPSALSL